MNQQAGLTPFITNMMKAPDEALRKVLRDVGPLAGKYEIPRDWAEFYIRTWLGRAR